MAAALAALVAAGVMWQRRDFAGTVPVESATRAVPAAAQPIAAGKTVAGREALPSPVDPARLEEVSTLIHDAVLTYAPAGVIAIRPYLLDPDPTIRRAARDGMVQLGEVDAVPLLRDAASKLEDPAEIAALREAADLLSLPAWSDSEEARDAAEEIRQNR